MYVVDIIVARQPLERFHAGQSLSVSIAWTYCPTFDPATTHSEGASHTICYHTHCLSDVQMSYPTRHSKFPFYRHGEGHVSNPQRPSPAKSGKLHLSFQPTQPAPRRNQHSRTDCTSRIASHISQSDIAGKAARSTSHVPGVCDFLLFRDGIYLFTTSRWASFSSTIGVAPGLVADKRRITPHRQDDTLSSKPMSNTHFFRPLATSPPPSRPQTYQPNPRVQPNERLLSYLPHSGFHNQRIALENALVLARLLNRTLLVPPIRFGRRAIPYRNLTVLRRALDANYTAYLCQISENAPNQSNTAAAQGALLDFSTLPEGCALGKKWKPVTYTYLPWGWITDFDFIRHLQPTIQIFGNPRSWLSFQLGLHANDILVIPDTSKYQYRFTDKIMLDPSLDRRTFTNATYSEDITLSSLSDHPAKLIQLGSLFGSRRLELGSHPQSDTETDPATRGPATPPATQVIY